MACCEKYKPYILKYKALISKYMPYIFDEKWYLIFNDLQEWKNMHFQDVVFAVCEVFWLKCHEKFLFCSAPPRFLVFYK